MQSGSDVVTSSSVVLRSDSRVAHGALSDRGHGAGVPGKCVPVPGGLRRAELSVNQWVPSECG